MYRVQHVVGTIQKLHKKYGIYSTVYEILYGIEYLVLSLFVLLSVG